VVVQARVGGRGAARGVGCRRELAEGRARHVGDNGWATEVCAPGGNGQHPFIVMVSEQGFPSVVRKERARGDGGPEVATAEAGGPARHDADVRPGAGARGKPSRGELRCGHDLPSRTRGRLEVSASGPRTVARKTRAPAGATSCTSKCWSTVPVPSSPV
jgi:hypothetical protein